MDIRNYVNAHPRYSERVQRTALEVYGGTTYVENRTGKVVDRLIESVRKGSTVRVYRAFLLAPVRGRTKTRRNKWADRLYRIKAAGGKLEALDNPGIGGAKLAMAAYEEIGMSGRGAPGQRKSGRPPIAYTPDQLVIIEREWNSKKHKTRAGALQAIRSYGIDVKLTWLYTHIK